MLPTIRIDDEVYAWLRDHAVPFEDTPNTVLRRLAGLDKPSAERSTNSNTIAEAGTRTSARRRKESGRRAPIASGSQLIRRWSIPVHQARFHRDGCWYQHLTDYPAAFCDPRGYVIFETEEEYRSSPHLRLAEQVNVIGPISDMPGYVLVDDPIE